MFFNGGKINIEKLIPLNETVSILPKIFQARKIDQCMIALDKATADKCTTKTSNCGSAVLVNLNLNKTFNFGVYCIN